MSATARPIVSQNKLLALDARQPEEEKGESYSAPTDPLYGSEATRKGYDR